ncbi:hypothetical protein K0U83_21415 [bacterium]|nr:hypothetical protein [bacterium]
MKARFGGQGHSNQNRLITGSDAARAVCDLDPDLLRYHLRVLARLSSRSGRKLVLMYDSPNWRVVELSGAVALSPISAEPEVSDAVSRATDAVYQETASVGSGSRTDAN